jgi:hypothetical protein
MIRIVQAARRLSFTELKAMKPLLKGLDGRGFVTFQLYL